MFWAFGRQKYIFHFNPKLFYEQISEISTRVLCSLLRRS